MIRAFLAVALLIVSALPLGASGYGAAVRVRVAVPYQPVVAVQQVYAQPIVQQVYAQPVVQHVQAYSSYCAAPVVQHVQQVQSYCAPVVVRQVQAYHAQPVQFVQSYSQQLVVRHSSAVSVRAPFVRVRIGEQGHHRRGGLFSGLRGRLRR